MSYLSFRDMRSVKVISLSLLLALAVISAPVGAQRSSSAIDARVDALLAQMTLAEKLGQLQQLDGLAEVVYRPEHPEMIRRGLLGSTLNVRGAKRTNGHGLSTQPSGRHGRKSSFVIRK